MSNESFDRTASHMAGEYVSYNEIVAWAYIKDGEFFDAVHPDEHDKYEGMYKTPLYTHPVKELTDEEIKDFLATFPIIFTVDDLCTFARAILRKAQE